MHTDYINRLYLLICVYLTFPVFNASDGFLLLADTLQLWRAAAARMPPALEASFNTTFTFLSSAVAFVVLLDSFPPLASHRGVSAPTDGGAMMTTNPKRHRQPRHRRGRHGELVWPAIPQRRPQHHRVCEPHGGAAWPHRVDRVQRRRAPPVGVRRRRRRGKAGQIRHQPAAQPPRPADHTESVRRLLRRARSGTPSSASVTGTSRWTGSRATGGCNEKTLMNR